MGNRLKLINLTTIQCNIFLWHSTFFIINNLLFPKICRKISSLIYINFFLLIITIRKIVFFFVISVLFFLSDILLDAPLNDFSHSRNDYVKIWMNLIIINIFIQTNCTLQELSRNPELSFSAQNAFFMFVCLSVTHANSG